MQTTLTTAQPAIPAIKNPYALVGFLQEILKYLRRSIPRCAPVSLLAQTTAITKVEGNPPFDSLHNLIDT
jgi:hypothetical protein